MDEEMQCRLGVADHHTCPWSHGLPASFPGQCYHQKNEHIKSDFKSNPFPVFSAQLGGRAQVLDTPGDLSPLPSALLLGASRWSLLLSGTRPLSPLTREVPVLSRLPSFPQTLPNNYTNTNSKRKLEAQSLWRCLRLLQR